MKVTKRLLYRRIGRELVNQELSHGSLCFSNNSLYNLWPGVSGRDDKDAEDLHRWQMRQGIKTPETQASLFEAEA